MRLPCSKGEQHLTSWGRRADAYIPCILEILFSNFYFSGSQQLCFRGAQEELFRSLYQVIWNGASSQIWMTPRRKCMESIYLVKGGNQLSWEVFPSFPSTVSLPAQVSRENSRGEAAGTMPALGAFGRPLQQEFGVFLHPSSLELSAGKTLCRV